MDNASKKAKRRQYNRPRMALKLDPLFRARLRAMITNQKDVATRIGRTQTWLNKYINGAGKATIDDVVLLTAVVVLGAEAPPPLTAEQRKLLRAWDALSPRGRAHVKTYMRLLLGRAPDRGGRWTESNKRSGQTNSSPSRGYADKRRGG